MELVIFYEINCQIKKSMVLIAFIIHAGTNLFTEKSNYYFCNLKLFYKTRILFINFAKILFVFFLYWNICPKKEVYFSPKLR